MLPALHAIWIFVYYYIILHNMTVLIYISFMSTCLALYLVSKPCGPSNVLVEVHKIHRYTPSHNCVLYLIHIYQSRDCFSYVSESPLTSVQAPISSKTLCDCLLGLDITQYPRSAEFKEEQGRLSKAAFWDHLKWSVSPWLSSSLGCCDSPVSHSRF